MPHIYSSELNLLHHELESTLTPRQRQLLAVGALTPEMCTPQQIDILKKMDPYLEGLTPEQAGRLGAMDTFAEGWEAGEESGNRLVKIMGVVFAAGVILGILALLAR